MTGWNPYAWAALLVIPSLFTWIHFIGAWAAGLYTAATFIFARSWYRPLHRALRSRLSERTALILTGLTFAAVTAFILVVYPAANSGWFGKGSDRDDALIIVVRETLAGRYPYYIATYRGHPVTPMPGAALLALPFVLAKQVALQNELWMGIFVLWLRGLVGKRMAVVLAFLRCLLLFSPEIAREMATGGDYLTNALYMVVATGLLFTTVCRPSPSLRALIGASVLFGIALSSRALDLLVVPVLFGAFWRLVGFKRALLAMGIAGAVFSVITLPFYFYDPAGFAPFNTVRKMHIPFPVVRWLVVVALIALTLLVSFRRPRAGLISVYWNCAIVMGIPVLAGALPGSVMAIITRGARGLSLPDLAMTLSYGLAAALFGLVAMWMGLVRSEEAAPDAPAATGTPEAPQPSVTPS